MADIVKENSNRTYQNPAKLLLLVPIGVIAFVYLFDIVFLKWNEYRIDKYTRQVIVDTLNHDTFKNEISLRDYISNKFYEYGYDEDFSYTVEVKDKYIYISATYEFFSLKGYVFSKNAHSSAVIIGYFDEYKKPVTMDYKNNQEIPDSNYYIMDQPEVNIE